MDYKDKNIFIYILIAGFILRLLLWVYLFSNNKITGHPDSRYYMRSSDLLVENMDFGKKFGANLAPLYPAFIGFTRRINDNYFFILFLQTIISLISIYFIYQSGKLISAKVAIISAIFASVHLGFIIYSNYILTEALFMPIFYSFLYFFIKFFNSKNYKYLFISGFILGLSALIRSVVMFLPYLCFIIIIILSSEKIYKRILYALLFYMIFLITISPWLIRNKILYNTPKLTAQGGPHLIGWVVSEIYRYEKNIDISTAMKEQKIIWKTKEAELPEKIRNNPFLVDKEVKKYTFQYIMNTSPVFIIKAWGNGIIKNIFSPVTMEIPYVFEMKWDRFHSSPGKKFLEQGFHWLFKNSNKRYSFIILFGIFGIIFNRIFQLIGVYVLIKNKNYNFLIISIMVMIYFLFINGPVGMLKYRLPFESILIIWSALGFVFIFNRKRKLIT